MNELMALPLPARQNFFRRLTKYPILAHYQRLFISVAMVNLYYLYHGVFVEQWWSNSSFSIELINQFVLINLTCAILIRQQYVVNMLFWLATRVPTSWPLKIRWHCAKVYHFGGIHTSCATFATVWFVIHTASLGYYLNQGNWLVSVPELVISILITVILLMMVLTALPQMRSRHHNLFELVHRFGGWSVLALFWGKTYLTIIQQNDWYIHTEFWTLCLVTMSILLPWLRLKRVPVDMVNPSSHVVLTKFNYGVTPFAGSATAVSRNPLLEWHSFANVPSPDEDGFRLTISRAGDWTGKLIDDRPSHLWVKGIPTAGVANIEVLFKRVVYVATGSGIGPCLPHLLANNVPSLLVWATRDPRKTYGDALVDEILAVQPNAIIWNTEAHGKPDMLKLSFRAYKEFDAEAVICISNQKLTNQVVFGMESRGIPAYGAIWDS